MENRLSDLRVEVADRMREAMHGKLLDEGEDPPELPHMIGVTELDEAHQPSNEEGTILDPTHEFWNDYYKEVDTMRHTYGEVKTAIETLGKDGTFEKIYPDPDKDKVYVRIDYPVEEEIDV